MYGILCHSVQINPCQKNLSAASPFMTTVELLQNHSNCARNCHQQREIEEVHLRSGVVVCVGVLIQPHLPALCTSLRAHTSCPASKHHNRMWQTAVIDWGRERVIDQSVWAKWCHVSPRATHSLCVCQAHCSQLLSTDGSGDKANSTSQLDKPPCVDGGAILARLCAVAAWFFALLPPTLLSLSRTLVCHIS